MINLGLIGKSISHSFSKQYVSETFFKGRENLFSYTNFDLDQLDGLLEIINTHHLSGLNVTQPYKEAVLSFLNEIDPIAEEIRAVNCIKISWKNNLPYLMGYNTDYYGFAQSIKPFLDPDHQKALVLGTGGASKAIHYALKHIGIEVYFVTTGAKAHANCFWYSELNEHMMNAFKLVINCTPLGLYPHVNQCPDIPYQYITPQHLLYDLIYNPAETLFLKKGKEKQATVINGLNMLKWQANKAWELWHTLPI